MFNLVVISGRLTANPELKTTPSGVPVCTFTIANDTGFGENKTTHFINIVAWRQRAEMVAKHFGKGSLIGIEGAIQTRKYTDKDGNNRTVFEVVANNIQFLEPKKVDVVKEDNSHVSTKYPMEQFKQQLDGFDGDCPF